MKPFRIGVFVAAGVFGGSSTLTAQELTLTERFALDNFVPGTPGGTVLGVPTLGSPEHLGAEVSVALNYMRRPFVATVEADDERTVIGLIDGRWTSDLGFSIGLFDRLVLEAGLPLVLSQSGPGLASDPRAETTAVDSFAIGDLSLAAKLRAFETGPLRAGIGARVWLPTGPADGFISDGTVRGMPFAVADVQAGPVLAALNVGYAIRGERQAHNFRSDDSINWGLGVHWRFVPAFALEGSLRGSHSPFAGPVVDERGFDQLPYPIEALGGAAVTVAGFRLGAAAGPGLNGAVGTPRWRAVFSLSYAVDPEPVLHRGSESSEFGDGSGAAADANAAAAAARAQSDEDGDGVIGLADMCPDVAGTAEKRGCAATDADGDGIDVSLDACPAEAEDADGFEDGDGCPDPDNDGDGFADATDSCPLEAETVNGKLDDDGCPDEVDVDIEVRGDRIDVRESVYFDSDRATIKQRSLAILRRVAAVLVAHPELLKLSIEGHTDDRGSARHNLELSARRAEAVRTFLVSEGVEAGRLAATGFGESHPVADNTTEDGRATNRRVEFLITSRED